ncbi:hypothetical protein, partial [Burkholderia thailandensis]|uniref:hypothetical protein n=1 Tax=Burkholderia thailandensis TaxID=57975 RepID=UPI001E3B07EB
MNYDRAANAAANRTQISLRGEARGTSRAARPRPRIASRFAAFLVFRQATSAPPAGQAHAACARNAASRIASSSGATPAGSGQQRPDKKTPRSESAGFSRMHRDAANSLPIARRAANESAAFVRRGAGERSAGRRR